MDQPKRLLDGAGVDDLDAQGAALLRKADEPLPEDVRARVWASLSARGGQPRMRRWPLAVGAAVAAIGVVALLWQPAGPPAGGRVIDVEGVVRVDGRRLDSDSPVAVPSRVQVSRGGSAELALARGVEIRVEGPAVVRLAANGAEVESGRAFHRVRPGRGRFVVGLGDVSVVVHGTQFWTGRAGTEAAVCLVEGSVEIRRSGAATAWLSPGDAWRSSVRAPAFPTDLPCRVPSPVAAVVSRLPVEPPPGVSVALPSAAPRAAPVTSILPTPPTACADAESEACRRELADGAGLAAENALYRLAEMRLARGDRRGALEAWLEYEERFPNGALAQEAALAVLELRLRLGAPQARDGAARFLGRWPRSEHAAEVHAIRGAISQRSGECRAALVDFDRALAGRISASRRDEALYGRAACLDALGRGEAAAAYATYLTERPDGRFADAAREGLRVLRENAD